MSVLFVGADLLDHMVLLGFLVRCLSLGLLYDLGLIPFVIGL